MTQEYDVVVMDTNAYRRLGCDRSAEAARQKGAGLARHSARLGAQAIAHPLVIMELLAHLADCDDPKWNDCHAAVIVAWEHCAANDDGTRRLGLLPDSDSLLCGALYGQRLDDEHLIMQELATACAAAATLDVSTVRDNAARFSRWAKNVRAVEDAFANDTRDLLLTRYPAIISGGVVIGRAAEMRRRALRELDAPEFLSDAAAGYVGKARWRLNLPLDEEAIRARVPEVLCRFPLPLYVYREFLKQVVRDDEVDVKAPKHRNTVWDIHIAFAVGDYTTMGHRVRLVTNDRLVLAAAEAADATNRVSRFEDYSEWLRNPSPE